MAKQEDNKYLNLVIKGNSKLPEIKYILKDNKLYFEGRSIAEIIDDRYTKVLKWIDEYRTDKILEVHFNLEYLNTTSAKMVSYLMKKLNNLNSEIYWYYEEDDEDMYELGLDYKSIIDKPFHFVEII